MKTTALMEEYISGNLTAISTIRKISDLFNPFSAVKLLQCIGAITRVEEGDLSKDRFRDIWIGKSEKPEGNIEQHPDGVKEIR